MLQDQEPKISVVVPFFQEEDVIQPFFEELLQILDGLDCPCEVVAVDDGSRDQTFARLARVPGLPG